MNLFYKYPNLQHFHIHSDREEVSSLHPSTSSNMNMFLRHIGHGQNNCEGIRSLSTPLGTQQEHSLCPSKEGEEVNLRKHRLLVEVSEKECIEEVEKSMEN